MKKEINFNKITDVLFRKITIPKKKLKKNYFIIFVGIPGAGKTTISNELSKKYNFVKVSTDCIKSYLKRCNYSFEIKDLFKIQRKIFNKLLNKRVDIISDSNSDLKKYRDSLKNLARKFNYQLIVMFMDVNINIAYQRILQKKNLKKSSKIYREIVNFKNSLEIPKRSIRIDSNENIKKIFENVIKELSSLI